MVRLTRLEGEKTATGGGPPSTKNLTVRDRNRRTDTDGVIYCDRVLTLSTSTDPSHLPFLPLNGMGIRDEEKKRNLISNVQMMTASRTCN